MLDHRTKLWKQTLGSYSRVAASTCTHSGERGVGCSLKGWPACNTPKYCGKADAIQCPHSYEEVAHTTSASEARWSCAFGSRVGLGQVVNAASFRSQCIAAGNGWLQLGEGFDEGLLQLKQAITLLLGARECVMSGEKRTTSGRKWSKGHNDRKEMRDVRCQLSDVRLDVYACLCACIGRLAL